MLWLIYPLPLLQGIVGNLASGKSALVHRYLTGTYVQEESPEGKNFTYLCVYEVWLDLDVLELKITHVK